MERDLRLDFEDLLRFGDLERDLRRCLFGDLLRDLRDFFGESDLDRDLRADFSCFFPGEADLDRDSLALDDLDFLSFFGVRDLDLESLFRPFEREPLFGESDALRSLPDDEGERAVLELAFRLFLILLGDRDRDLDAAWRPGDGERDPRFKASSSSWKLDTDFFLEELTSSGRSGDDDVTLLSCCGKNALSGKWPNKTVLVFSEPGSDVTPSVCVTHFKLYQSFFFSTLENTCTHLNLVCLSFKGKVHVW